MNGFNMNYFFDKSITVENVNELIEKLQNSEDKINLWFSTEGGNPDAMSFLIKFLNSKNGVRITLTNWVMSTGTHILTDFKGEIKLGEGLDFLLFHMVDRESYSLRKGEIDESILTKQDFARNKIFAKKLKKKGLLTDKQIKRFLNGKDVIVYQEQFSKWNIE